MMRRLFLVLTVLCAFLTPTAFARADDAPPSRDSLIKTWEDSMHADPSTVTLNKTGAGEYDFETKLFPYEGKLKIWNALIEKDPDIYDEDYNFSDELKKTYVGYIEANLPDADKDLFKDHYKTSRAWERLNVFYYDAASGKWLTPQAWLAAANARKQDEPKGCGASPGRASGWKTYLVSQSEALGPVLVFFVILWGFIMLMTRKQRERQKNYLAKYDESVARQLASVEMQKESLELQRQILESLKERK